MLTWWGAFLKLGPLSRRKAKVETCVGGCSVLYNVLSSGLSREYNSIPATGTALAAGEGTLNT